MKELLQKIENAGLIMDVVDGKLKLYSESSQIDPEIVTAIKSQKEEITAYLIGNGIGTIAENQYVNIPLIPLNEFYPISDAQRRLWILSQFDGGSVAYNMPGSLELKGSYELELLQQSFDSVLERHEILRTVFGKDKTGEIKQKVLKKKAVDFKIDYRDFRKEKNKEELVKNYIAADSYKAFNLESGPLLRASLLQLEDEQSVFYFNMHHIISDGWSMEVLKKDIFSHYEAYKGNRSPQLKDLRIQYKDYSTWQLAQIEEESFKIHRTYWLDSLKGELPLLDLPGRKQLPKIKTNDGQVLGAYIDEVTTTKLKKYSQEKGGSLFMSLLAVWNVLMYRYTSQKDIIIGTPVAGREHADLEDQIGFYVNTLALRNEIKPEESFDELFSRIKQNMLHAYSHQLYSFDRLVDELGLASNTNRNAVFDVMLTLEYNGERSQEIDPRATRSNQVIELGYSPAKFDIDLSVKETGDYLSLQLVYNMDVYEREIAENLINHYRQLLSALLARPEEKISQVEYLSSDEKHELLFTFNNTAVEYPKDKTIIDLFAEQVIKNPDYIAVVFEDKKLTYKELNERSNQLADYLLKIDQLSKGDYININIKRSEYLIITLLGVLKSGFAYVLLDPLLPEERLNFILKDSGSKLLIDDTFINNFHKQESFLSKENPGITIQPEDIMYLMYTSGSTGNPKGAINIYRGFTNTVRWYADAIKLSKSDRVGIISNLSFDLTQKNYFAPLITGAAVYIDSEFNPTRTIVFVKDHKISVINCAPTMFYSLLDEKSQGDLNSLKKVILGGESINLSSIKSFLETNDSDVFNSYGPSEASDVSIYHQLIKGQSDIIPIGKPVWNTTAFIVDDHLKLVPAGVSGEICIGGIGLGLGYLNQKKLTDEKFVHTKEWGRIYRTGDIGKYNLKGEIEFIGRVDNQVKIRGHRIELEEIENKIQHFDEIIKQVCVEAKIINNEQVLIAYIVVHSSFNKSSLREDLQKKLPVYMIPSYFVELPQLPLNSNGKIDRKSLPDPQSSDLSSRAEYVAPRNELEQKLVEIWQEILNIERVGITDNFFELGGNSLKILSFNSKLYKMDYAINYIDIYKKPTIQALSLIIEENKTKALPEINEGPNIRDKEFYKLSPKQKRWWLDYLEDFSKEKSWGNIVSVQEVNERFSVKMFEKSVIRFIENHEIFRTNLVKVDGEVYQKISDNTNFQMDTVMVTSKELQKELDKLISKANRYIFDFETECLLKFIYVKSDEKSFIILHTHHILIDGISLNLLGTKIFEYYKLTIENKEILNEALQCRNVSEYQNEHYGSIIEKSKLYWQKKLVDLKDYYLPVYNDNPNNDTAGANYRFALPQEIDLLFSDFAKSEGISKFTVILSVYNLLMMYFSKSDDMIIGSPLNGRERQVYKDHIGFFINLVLIRVQLYKQDNFSGFANRVHENYLEALEHQEYQINDIVNDINYTRNKYSLPITTSYITQVEHKSEYTKENVEYEFTGVDTRVDLMLNLEIFSNKTVLNFAHKKVLFDEEIFKSFTNKFIEFSKKFLTNSSNIINLN